MEFGPGPKQATVYDGDSGEPTVVGSTQLTDGTTLPVTLPVTIKFGKATVKVREAKLPVDITFECKCYHVDRRRLLRLYDATLPYAERSIVVPTVGDPEHYGSS